MSNKLIDWGIWRLSLSCQNIIGLQVPYLFHIYRKYEGAKEQIKKKADSGDGWYTGIELNIGALLS